MVIWNDLEVEVGLEVENILYIKDNLIQIKKKKNFQI
jgi:hypothetical protein